MPAYDSLVLLNGCGRQGAGKAWLTETLGSMSMSCTPQMDQTGLKVVRLCAKTREAVASPVEHLTLHYQVGPPESCWEADRSTTGST